MLGAVLFTIGAVGLLVRRNPLVMFMCVELMLNAVNLTFVTFARELDDIGGQVVVFFVLVVAAAEVVVGLGIIVSILRRRPGATADDMTRAEGLTRTDARPGLAHPRAARWPASSLLLVFGRRLGEPLAGWLATALIGGSFVAAVRRVPRPARPARARSGRFTQTLFDVAARRRLPGRRRASWSTRCRSPWCLFVTGVGTLIHLYAIGYMHGDQEFPKFFVYLNLFAFSMLMLVLGDNLLLTFLGWEGVGACSYFLISFWFTERRQRLGRQEGLRHQPHR